MKTTLAIVALSVATAFPLASIAAEQAPSLERGICVMDAAALSGFADLQAYVKGNIPVPTRYESVTPAKGMTSDSWMAKIASIRTPADAAVVALVELPGPVFLVADPDRHVTLVNVTALELKTAAKPAVRLGQQTLRGLGAAMGVGFQYDPHCVMQPIKTVADLDKLGGNFSPPALQQLMMALSTQGVVPLTSRLRKAAPPAKK